MNFFTTHSGALKKTFLQMAEGKLWYALYTKPSSEKKVAEHLKRKGLETYCPMNKTKKKWGERNEETIEPLFQSFVFVHIHDEEQQLVKKCDGVLNLVHWLDKPAVIPALEIDIIKSFVEKFKYVGLKKIPVSVNRHDLIDLSMLIEKQSNNLPGKTVVLLPTIGYRLEAIKMDEKIDNLRPKEIMRLNKLAEKERALEEILK